MEKKTGLITLLLVCLFSFFYYQGTISPAYGGELYQKTKTAPRDIYLDLEAICGCEGLPYEFMIPKEEYIKTKIDPNDIYLDLEAFCSEDMPYKYLIIPGDHIKTKIDYKEERKFGFEEMLSEDPTSLIIKSKE